MARRRANGEGTIRRRKDGRYEARIYVPVVGGGSKRITLYGRTQAEVREKLLDKQQDVRQGKHVPGTSQRVDAFLDYWLEQVIRPNKRPSTYAEYSWITENFLKPGLGSYTLDQLSVAVFQTWLNKIHGDGTFVSPNGKSRKVTADRVSRLRKILSTALSRAVREELVPRNIAENVDLPSYRPKERTPWSADEARRFLTAAMGHELYPAFLVLVLYGMRRGEVMGLRWGDVDFERGVVRIRNTLQRVKGSVPAGTAKDRSRNPRPATASASP